MNKAFFLISAILFFQMAIFGQDKDVCVEIKTVDKIGVGENLKVTADLKVDFLTAPQKLHWKTSNGQTLTKDDFTAEFAINKEDAGKALKVSLEFEGLPDNCLKVYEKNVYVTPIKIPEPFDKYENSYSWNDEKARLMLLADELRQQKNVNCFIVIQTKSPTSKKLAQRKSRIITYLTKEQKIPKDKITVKIEKSFYEVTMFWLISKGVKNQLNILSLRNLISKI
jgi:hypothetical protein